MKVTNFFQSTQSDISQKTVEFKVFDDLRLRETIELILFPAEKMLLNDAAKHKNRTKQIALRNRFVVPILTFKERATVVYINLKALLVMLITIS